ncbi:hypothetical protein [Ferrovum myxofaciens]|uniref:hypothetical protein n=1 Tax=Ferrovum myxofaciens TaxID=416213 RepID=UPI003EBEEBAB
MLMNVAGKQPDRQANFNSGAIGIFTTGGTSNALIPLSGSNGATVLTLPTSGSFIAKAGRAAAAPTGSTFHSLTLPALGTSNASGFSVDISAEVGVAFSFTSKALSFFSLTNFAELGHYTCGTSCNTSLSFSGASPEIGGVVLDPAKKFAIFSNGSGFDVLDYTTPSAPRKLRTISLPSTNVTENFGYHPSLSVGGVTYSLIVTGGYYSLEFVDASAGKVYIPDATTSTKLGGITSSACSVDHISVDVSYNVAVLGCEFSGTNQGFLIDLNKLALNPSAGTYSLPTTAILPFTLPAYEMDDVAVDSNNHLAFVGSGGYAGTVGYFIGKLNDPRTSPLGFSLTTGSSILSMPVFSSTNVSNCTITGCTPLTIGGQWHGWYDPHAIGAFTDSTGNSIVLWENNTKTAISVINMSEIIAGSSLMPTLSIWYQGLP